MAYVKRPNGFRAVRMRGKTEVVYCLDRDEKSKILGLSKYDIDCDVDVYSLDWKGLMQCTTAQFNAMYTREHSPMPDAVRAMFACKPSFADWWDGRKAQK